MNKIHAILLEDFGPLDRDLIRTDLLGQPGICGVYCKPVRNGLVIEYDPVTLNRTQLLDIMCRAGLFPEHPHDADAGEDIGDG